MKEPNTQDSGQDLSQVNSPNEIDENQDSDQDQNLVNSLQTMEKDSVNFELWKYFEGRAETLKEKRWSTATWLLSIMQIILIFPFTVRFVEWEDGELIANAMASTLLIWAIGFLFSVYSLLVLLDYTHHIEKNWNRSEIVLSKHDYKPNKNSNNSKTIKFSKTVCYCTAIFPGLLFVVMMAKIVCQYIIS